MNFYITLGGVSRDGNHDIPKEKVGLVDTAIGKADKVGSLLTSPFSSSDIVGDR